MDWNNAAEQSIEFGLGMVPEVGPLLSTLVSIFWPSSGTDIWAQIEQQVEQLIQQALTQLVQEQVSASLQGLNNNLESYLTALKDGTGDPSYISEKWNVANGDFLQQLPTFQLPDYQLLLLPLFAQFANMHLSLLRDGVVGGAAWGWTPAIIAQTQTDLTNAIANYRQYAPPVYQSGLADVKAKTKANNHSAEPFRSVNNYVRQMTLTVLDFVNMWQYFDVSKYSGPVTVYLDREIYTDPQGTCDNSGPIVLPSAPTQPISQISVWAWDRVDAVQLTYPSGGGPGGVTKTARMGDQGGGSNAPPHGGVFNVTSNPVTIATAASGDIVNYMTFKFANGSSSGKLGGNYPGGTPINWSFANEILSSIHINGISSSYGSADCVVFGFKYQQSQQVDDEVRKLVFVASPVVPAALAQSAPAAWQDARTAYWKTLQSKVRQ
jgi:hypothetical protein